MVAVTVVIPARALLAMPADFILATSGEDNVQVTQGVTSLVVPSLKLAMTLNLVELPSCRATAAGDTTIELAFAPVTVSWAVPTSPSSRATMVEVPAASPLTSPAETVATEGAEDVHNAKPVRSCVLPSANVPSAVKANPVCAAMLALAGEIWITVNCGLTRIVLVPVTAPNCAEIVAFPGPTAPTLPVLSTAATAGFEELQVTSFVMTCVVPSLRVAVAVQSTKLFGASSAVAGVTEIDDTVAVVTSSGVELVTPLKVAEMLAVPGLTAVAMSVLLSIVATAVLSELNVTSFVMFWTLLSLNRPDAVKSSVVPTAIVCDGGMTVIDTIVAFVILSVVEAAMDPRVAVMVELPADSPFESPVLRIWATAVLDDAQVTCRVTF